MEAKVTKYTERVARTLRASRLEARYSLREVAARASHGGEGRLRAARFPARKALEEFDFDYQRSLKRDQIAHLGTLDFIASKQNVVFLGPPGTGRRRPPPG